MFKIARRAFHVISAQERNMRVERNLYYIRYVIRKDDCKLGKIKIIEDNHDEIIVTFENPEISKYIKQKMDIETPEPELRYHYAS